MTPSERRNARSHHEPGFRAARRWRACRSTNAGPPRRRWLRVRGRPPWRRGRRRARARRQRQARWGQRQTAAGWWNPTPPPPMVAALILRVRPDGSPSLCVLSRRVRIGARSHAVEQERTQGGRASRTTRPRPSFLSTLSVARSIAMLRWLLDSLDCAWLRLFSKKAKQTEERRNHQRSTAAEGRDRPKAAIEGGRKPVSGRCRATVSAARPTDHGDNPLPAAASPRTRGEARVLLAYLRLLRSVPPTACARIATRRLWHYRSPNPNPGVCQVYLGTTISREPGCRVLIMVGKYTRQTPTKSIFFKAPFQ